MSYNTFHLFLMSATGWKCMTLFTLLDLSLCESRGRKITLRFDPPNTWIHIQQVFTHAREILYQSPHITWRQRNNIAENRRLDSYFYLKRILTEWNDRIRSVAPQVVKDVPYCDILCGRTCTWTKWQFSNDFSTITANQSLIVRNFNWGYVCYL